MSCICWVISGCYEKRLQVNCKQLKGQVVFQTRGGAKNSPCNDEEVGCRLVIATAVFKANLSGMIALHDNHNTIEHFLCLICFIIVKIFIF